MFLTQLQIKLKKSHKEKGEISIYLSLVFTLIISLLLTVITGARGAALQVVFECAMESALLSTFGEYNKELLERYDVLFVDLSYLSNSPDPKNLEARLNEYFDDNFHPENGTSFIFYSDLLDVTDTNVSLTEYELATDRFGEPFADQVVEYMSNLIGVSEVKKMTDFMDIWNSYDLNTEKFTQIKEEAFKSFGSNEEDTWEQTVIKDKLAYFANPDISAVVLLKGDYIILSQNYICLGDTLFFRSKENGIGDMNEFDFDPASNVYFNEYIMSKMSNYIERKEEAKIKCAVEYIIAGNESDAMNVDVVLKLIYAFRALEDYISLNLATDKVDEVKPVGEALEALIRVPEPVITQVILVCWAALEGLQDLYDLLKGEKVPLIKTSDEIKVSLDGLISMLGGVVQKGEDTDSVPVSESGIPKISLGYTDYLRILLFILPSPLKTYHTMDIIEIELKNSETGNEYFRFDVCADKVKAIFSVETGFDFRFTGEKKYSYF